MWGGSAGQEETRVHRSTLGAAQVLSIVYLGGKGKGGFFPNGLNGSLK